MGNQSNQYPSIWDYYGESVTIQLIHADCLEVDWPQVDAIITDVPYGVTACKWDSIIPFEPMWAKIKSSLKPRGAFVTTASQPFTSALVMSNPKWFKYEWIWIKNNTTGMFLSKCQPLKNIENILVFGKDTITYNRQMTKKTPEEFKKSYRKNDSTPGKSEHYTSKKIRQSEERQWLKPPTQTLYFKRDTKRDGKSHPTQKPVALYEYLIKTYTNEGDTVLDFCMGSGTTGQACINTGRNFIGIEKDEKYFNIAKERLGL